MTRYRVVQVGCAGNKHFVVERKGLWRWHPTCWNGTDSRARRQGLEARLTRWRLWITT